MSDDSSQEVSDCAPECDILPHVNIGRQFQCQVPQWRSNSARTDREPSYEHLLWDPGISKVTTNNEGEYGIVFDVSSTKFCLPLQVEGVEFEVNVKKF